MKDGGRILVVGGGMSDLPPAYQNHPQVLIWDDNKQGHSQREVPSNVRVIIYNRWISHATAQRLSEAARSLRALKFPMLRTRDIKTLLSEVVQADPSEEPAAKIEEAIIAAEQFEMQPAEESPVVKKQDKRKESPLRDFVAKFMDPKIDYTQRGAIRQEGQRLIEIAKREGVKTTPLSLTNAVGILAKQLRKSRGEAVPEPRRRAGTPRVKTSSASGGDDFEQLDQLIDDAIAAMKLVQEHLPKVRRETERLRGMREKVLKLFGGE